MKDEKKKELTVTGNSPADMIKMAVAGGADLDKLEKLLTLQERWEANEARKVFASSFARVQANIVLVVKTKDNPQTHSKYAGLDDIIKSAKPIYTVEGFSIIFYEGQTPLEGNIRICADVLHTAGHKEIYYYDVPLDGVGIKGNANMTRIHAKASSTSYGKRYLMCMIWNIPTGDDDDGCKAGKPEVTMPEAKEPTTPPSKSQMGPAAPKEDKGKDIPETKEMNVRAAEIADIFKQSKNLVELAGNANHYRPEINAKMSKSYKKWLIDQLESNQERIQAEMKEQTGE